mmetsp:Transcript_572/g.883  ORF Transcript_572/g.883 Transcript_572/m.883 type:complete len:145 (-) Transcript_572:1926-2360(-)
MVAKTCVFLNAIIRMYWADDTDTPDEINKWLESRRRNFPTRSNLAAKALRAEEDHGELSKLELRMRKRIALMRKLHVKKDPPKRGHNPFSKYQFLRNRMIMKQQLSEQSAILQCFRYIIKQNFFEEAREHELSEEGEISESELI